MIANLKTTTKAGQSDQQRGKQDLFCDFTFLVDQSEYQDCSSYKVPAMFCNAETGRGPPQVKKFLCSFTLYC